MNSFCKKLVLILVLCIGSFTNAYAYTGTQGVVFFPPENPQDCNQNTYLNWAGPGSHVRCEPLPTITALECPEGYAGAKLADNTDLKLCILVAKQPKNCPQYMPPLCGDDEELVGGGVGSDGCDLAPQCKKKVIVTSCPIFMPPLCGDGEELVSGGVGNDGCDLAPQCKKKVTVTSCPVFMPPLCKEGEVLVGGGKGSDGCDLAPTCKNKTFSRSLGKI